jgi:hypothetical protein
LAINAVGTSDINQSAVSVDRRDRSEDEEDRRDSRGLGEHDDRK